MNDGQMPEDETAFANEKEKQVNKQKINQSRRKFARAGLIGVPAFLTLTSKPVLAVNECTFSGNLSGNMSDARVNDPCDNLTGFSPLHWLTEITSARWTNALPIFVGLIGGGSKQVTPDTKFADIDLFANPNTANIDANTSLALVLSLSQSADDAERLAAQATAALLNAATDPNYVYSTAEILTLYNDNYANPYNAGILLESFENLNTVN